MFGVKALALNHPSDIDLVKAARRGDRDALGALLDRHWDMLVALCRRALGDPDLAQDAAQEAALRALLGIDRLRDPTRFGLWLGGIGLNVARQWIRERTGQAWSWEAVLGGRQAMEPASPEPGPEERGELAELAERVWDALEDLPPGQRQAVLLYYMGGLTQSEVSAVLRVGPGAMKSRLHKARANLRGRLLPLWKEEQMSKGQANGFIEMRVVDVRRSAGEGEAKDRFVVLLQDEGTGRGLPIWVGPFEGTGMAMLLERSELPRPMTFQFVSNVLKAVGGKLKEVRINRLMEQTFYAEAVVEGPAGTNTVDARPSDALALAVLTGARIRVSTSVLEGVERREDGEGFQEVRDRYADGAAEIAERTRRDWERSLEEWRKSR